MKYLCLAYGDEKDWKALSKSEQDALLLQDDVLRKRGDLVAAVQTAVTTVRAWDGIPATTEGTVANPRVPLAGFCIIEAADLNEVVRLVAQTPCARAKGAIEVRPIAEMNDARSMTQPTFIPLPGYLEYPIDDMKHRAAEFYQHIRRRRTVREFSARLVPRAVIEDCLRVAGTAPNGANMQPWHFVVVSDAAIKQKIRVEAEQEEHD